METIVASIWVALLLLWIRTVSGKMPNLVTIETWSTIGALELPELPCPIFPLGIAIVKAF
jgi:hypothetical protein